MKNTFLLFAIAIVLTTVGCSTTPKIASYGNPIGNYTFGQAPQNTQFANEGRDFDRNARLQNKDRLANQRQLTLDEYAFIQRTNQLGLIKKEIDAANALGLRIEGVPAPTPARPTSVNQPVAAPAPARQGVQTDTDQNGVQRLRPGRSTSQVTPSAPANVVAVAPQKKSVKGFLRGLSQFLGAGSIPEPGFDRVYSGGVAVQAIGDAQWHSGMDNIASFP
ncbi:MAG: hypothetical protein Q7R93_01490 [bacterium]|nr:hypothetical protein [bacterium]